MRHLATDSIIEYTEASELTGLTQVDVDHLGRCPKCFVQSQEWSYLFQSLRLTNLDTPPDYATRKCIGLFQRKPATKAPLLQQIVATLMFDSQFAPESYGIRGGSDARQIRFCGGDADVHIRVSANGTRITGQMLHRADGDFLVQTPITLSCAGQKTTGVTDDLGQFGFTLNEAGELRFEAELPSGFRLTTIIKVKEQESCR